MSVFTDFQDAWAHRFPGCELPQAWEDDVRANLDKHNQRVNCLREELEKEEFYVEYLERLLHVSFIFTHLEVALSNKGLNKYNSLGKIIIPNSLSLLPASPVGRGGGDSLY